MDYFILLFMVILALGCCQASDFFGSKNYHSFSGAGKATSGPDDEYYKILGVDRQASEKDIKKAYRKLVGSY